MSYTELQVTTNYSFLRGASQIEELFAQAAVLGLPALGITDRNTLAGIPRAHQRAKIYSSQLFLRGYINHGERIPGSLCPIVGNYSCFTIT